MLVVFWIFWKRIFANMRNRQDFDYDNAMFINETLLYLQWNKNDVHTSIGTRCEKLFTFIDSINFVNPAVSNFPKTFGLTELKTGFFST